MVYTFILFRSLVVVVVVVVAVVVVVVVNFINVSRMSSAWH